MMPPGTNSRGGGHRGRFKATKPAGARKGLKAPSKAPVPQVTTGRLRGERIDTMVTAPIGHDGKPLVLEVRLLGRFAVAAGGRTAGPWPRPSARRLCQLLLVSPGRRLSRDGACDALFPSLAPGPAAHALYKAQSMARSVLLPLGPKAGGLLRSDRAQLWFSTDIILHVDLDGHEQALRSALRASPGLDRDTAIIHALATDGVLLEDEPDAEWACRVRERLEYVRQEAASSSPATAPGASADATPSRSCRPGKRPSKGTRLVRRPFRH